MTNFREMVSGHPVNAAALRIKPDRGSRSSASDTARAGERFFKAAANLPEGVFLGWQIEKDEEGGCRAAVFTGAGVRTMALDYNWIFRKCAEAGNRPSHMLQDLFEDDRKVYVLVRENGVTESIKKKGEFEDVWGDEDDDGDYCSGQYFPEMFELLQQSDAVVRMTAARSRAEGSCCGRLFISLPKEAGLSLQTAVSLSFSGMRLTELSEDFRADTADGCLSDGYFLDSFARFLSVLKSRLQPEYTPQALADLDIEELELSLRSYNCLKRAGIHTAGQLLELSDDELRDIRNLGSKSIEEIREVCDFLLAQAEKNARTARPAAQAAKDRHPKKKSAAERLEELVGLAGVKEQLRKIAAYAKMKKNFCGQDRDRLSLSLHMEFTGNPGTAKTTVARLLAEYFCEIGLLADSAIVEAGRADLVARYVGQTAEKVKEVFRKAKGRLLFIDEAYALSETWKGSYGDEAINTIVQEMENHRDETIVIFAGYPEEMDEFFSRNPGLRSRVPFHLHFADYTPEEMLQITEREARLSGFLLEDAARQQILAACEKAAGRPEAGNGRFCRNLAEQALLNYAVRVYGNLPQPDHKNRDRILLAEDFTLPEGFPEEKKTRPIGFRAG